MDRNDMWTDKREEGNFFSFGQHYRWRCTHIYTSESLFSSKGSVVCAYIIQYLWPASNSPRYSIAMGFSAGCCVAIIVLTLIIRRVLIRENRKIRLSDSGATAFYVY